MKSILILILKVILLTFLMFILMAIGGLLVTSQPDASQTTSGSSAASMFRIAIVCLIDVIILTYFILRARLTGIKLMIITAILFYGIKTFLAVIEFWFFVASDGTSMNLFLFSVPQSLFFPVIAVPLLGIYKRKEGLNERTPAIWERDNRGWIWKIALLILIVYPLLYFTFGYFIAWQNYDVRAYYNGEDYGSFLKHFSHTFKETPWLYFFQVGRGLIWVILALLVIRAMKGNVWEVGLFTAFLFALVMNDSHLIPNPLMPPAVQKVHFIETASSNFIWGLCIVLVLKWREVTKYTRQQVVGR